MIFCGFQNIWVFGYSRSTLVSIVGELAGGGSVAMAVDVSDMGQVTGEM